MMVRASVDPAARIERWCDEEFHWSVKYPSGTWGHTLKRAPDGGVVFFTRRNGAALIPEAIDWLNGQTSPPPEPLREGEAVCHDNGWCGIVVHPRANGRVWVDWRHRLNISTDPDQVPSPPEIVNETSLARADQEHQP